MNEHMWKKLGEVKAFASACIDFLDRGRMGFVEAGVFSNDEINQFIEKNESHIEHIDEIASTVGENDTVDDKAEATGKKLADMQERYLSDEEDWEDGMELLEWSGFFFGGAIVHWNLMRGTSETVHEADLTALVGSASSFHAQMMDTVTESIYDLAKEEAQN